MCSGYESLKGAACLVAHFWCVGFYNFPCPLLALLPCPSFSLADSVPLLPAQPSSPSVSLAYTLIQASLPLGFSQALPQHG